MTGQRERGLRVRPNLATMAPNIPFLDSLAAWWLHRTGALQLGTSQAAVADGMFIVPTRRAARGLSAAFLRQAEGRPLLLPRILPLGGIDETPLSLSGGLDLPPAVPPQMRLSVLTRFILAMGGRNGAPADADRAWALAEEMAAKPPQVLRMTKRLLMAARKMELAELLDLSALFQGMAHNTADHIEAVTAMLEKRSPSFRGG